MTFEDGTTEDNIDAIVYATGYNFAFPFLKTTKFEVPSGGKSPLYKFVFPADVVPPTLAVIGFVFAIGGFAPVVELQCRWAARVFQVRQGAEFK